METLVPVLDCGGRSIALDRTRICAVLNVTPDSFSDGGSYFDTASAIARGERMVEQGADMIEVGGESTRPGAEPVSTAAELDRVIPVIKALANRVEVPVSVDTSRAEVMRAAVAAGAGMINDVRALHGEGALDAVFELAVPVCVMHMQGNPGNMQDAPEYRDVVAEVHRFLAERVFACELAGIQRSQVLVDPGFGFGKTLEHNLELLNGLKRFRNLGAGILVGLSRKASIGALTGRAAGERVAGSVAAALIAAQRGAAFVRAHDVAETRDALAIWHALIAQRPVARDQHPSAPHWDDDD